VKDGCSGKTFACGLFAAEKYRRGVSLERIRPQTEFNCYPYFLFGGEQAGYENTAFIESVNFSRKKANILKREAIFKILANGQIIYD
jgi:hypothetical protein